MDGPSLGCPAPVGTILFCDFDLVVIGIVVQKGAFDGFGHWALVMHRLDAFGKNRVGVVCGSQCSFFSTRVFKFLL